MSISPKDIRDLKIALDGGVPEGMTEEEAKEAREAMSAAVGVAGLIVRGITESTLHAELAAYARRAYDAFTDAGLPADIVRELTVATVSGMAGRAQEAAANLLE